MSYFTGYMLFSRDRYLKTISKGTILYFAHTSYKSSYKYDMSRYSDDLISNYWHYWQDWNYEEAFTIL